MHVSATARGCPEDALPRYSVRDAVRHSSPARVTSRERPGYGGRGGTPTFSTGWIPCKSGLVPRSKRAYNYTWGKSSIPTGWSRYFDAGISSILGDLAYVGGWDSSHNLHDPGHVFFCNFGAIIF